jgi:PPP family 3-phenylpropionic acid transporter
MTSPPANRLRLFPAPFFFLYGAVGVIFPFFSLWLRDWGYSDSRIAFLVAMQGLATIVWSQAWGYAADMIVTQKRLLLFNSLMACVFFALMPWTQAFAGILALTFLFASFSSPLGQFLHSLLLGHQLGERHFSLIRSIGSIGFIVVNLLVGYSCKQYGSAVIFPWYVGTLAVFCLTLFPIREEPRGRAYRQAPDGTAGVGTSVGPTPNPLDSEADFTRPASATRRRIGFRESQGIFFRRPAVVRFLIFVFVYQLGHALSHSFQGLWVRDLGGSDQTVALCYSLAAGAEVLVFWTADRLLAGRSAVRWLYVAAVCQIVRWGLLWVCPVLPVVIASNVLHAITFGLFFSASVVFIHRLSPPELRTTGQTIFGLAYFGLAALGSNLLGSVVLKWVGLQGWYGIAAVLGLAATLIVFTIPREDI